MASLISTCRGAMQRLGFGRRGEGNSPCVRRQRRAKGKTREEPEKRGDLPKVTPQRAGREPGAWLLCQPHDLSARLCYSKVKASFSPPSWGCVEDSSWLLACFLAAVAKAAEFLNVRQEKKG